MALQKLTVKIKAHFVTLTVFSCFPEMKELILTISKNDEQQNHLIIDYKNKKFNFANAENLTNGDKKGIKQVLEMYLEYLIR